MAKVYLARDLKHDRQVALKVLRPSSERSSGQSDKTNGVALSEIMPYDSTS
jgi:serine/threonine protein kinase